MVAFTNLKKVNVVKFYRRIRGRLEVLVEADGYFFKINLSYFM